MSKDSINTHKHKQYFTPEILSNFMVNLIPDDNINTVIDLSMGECALLESAKKRWSNASYLGSDIDEILLEKIHKKNPYIKTFLGDSLGDKINSWKEYSSIISKRGFDLVLAKDCYGENTSFRENLIPDATEKIVYPTKELNDLIIKHAKKLNKQVKFERILTEEAFYSVKSVDERIKMSGGAVCVEMESYGLFTVAEKLNKKAACLLTISDNLVTKEYTTSEQRQNSFNEMMVLALDLAEDFQ